MDVMDMDSDPLDLVDLKEYLEYDNVLHKGLGFSWILKRVLEGKLNVEEEKKYRQELFDCFYKYGDVPLECLLESLPALLRRRNEFAPVVTREQILAEFTLRINDITNIEKAFPAVLNASLPSFSDFLIAAKQIDPKILTTMFVGRELQSEHYRYILVMIFSGIFDDEQKRVLGNLLGLEQLKSLFLLYHPDLYLIEERGKYDAETFLRRCPVGELKSHPMVSLDFFQKLKLLHERPQAIRNPNIGRHVIYKPYMLQMVHFYPQMAEVVEEYLDLKKDIDDIYGVCQKHAVFPTPDFKRFSLTMEKMLAHYIAIKKIPYLVKYLEYCLPNLNMLREPWYLPALIALLPHTQNDEALQKRIVDMIVTVLDEKNEHAASFILYFIGIFSMPFYTVNQDMIMEQLVKISRTKHQIRPTVRFISLYTEKGPFRLKSLECLSKLALKHSMSLPHIIKKIKLNDEQNEEMFRANMVLAKDCCIATDSNEDLLSMISVFCGHDGFRLAAAVDAANHLVRNDVLDLMQMRSQIERKVYAENNEASLVPYCALLGWGSSDEEINEEESGATKKTLVTELCKLREHSNNAVASAAWKSLGGYAKEYLTDFLNIPPSSYGEILTKIPFEQYVGFIDFLCQQIEHEKETYGRPLYNQMVQPKDVQPFLTKVDKFMDRLNKKNKDEKRFWGATLPLTATHLQLAAPSAKAHTAVRLLKGCLLHVPPATSNQEMLKLMAGWRICINASLDALAESNKNDVLWARDQIVNEGRISLASKNESVDNIMMMLTVLVDAIDNKLRFIESSRTVAEIVNAQKPWVISVFEFIATRLPKELKGQREARVNPIYQVKTQSNKNSLHTAIFCIRLLIRHTAVVNFYQHELHIGLPVDPIYEYLFASGRKKLEPKNIPNRYQLWIMIGAFGFDEMTGNAIEDEYSEEISEITILYKDERSLKDASGVRYLFDSMVRDYPHNRIQTQNEYVKDMEKYWNANDEEYRMDLYEGLGELALVSGSQKKKVTIGLEKLSDSSVLKGILEMFDAKYLVKPEVLRHFIHTFVNHKRSDKRYLPPVDWLKFLERAEWRKAKADVRKDVIRLACEQKIPEVLFRFAKSLTTKELHVVAEHLPAVIKMLPRKQVHLILNAIVITSRDNKEDINDSLKLVNAIAEVEKDPVVHDFLITALPQLTDTVDVTDRLLNALKEPHLFCGTISNCFDVWLEARNGEKMNITRIMELVDVEDDELSLFAMYAIVSLESRRLSNSQKIEKILELITVNRVMRSKGKDLFSFFPIFLSVVVSINETVPIPVCFFGLEGDIVEMLQAGRRPFFQALLQDPAMPKVAKEFGSFLRPYFDSEESHIYDTWQKNSAKDLFLYLLAQFGTDAFDSLIYVKDNFWQTLLPID